MQSYVLSQLGLTESLSPITEEETTTEEPIV
jgi:hypothetical protein